MFKAGMGVIASLFVVSMLNTGCSDQIIAPEKIEIYQGIFVDNEVDGLTYQCGNLSGPTSSGGIFVGCLVDDPVTFYLGNLKLGTMKRPSNGVFTPTALANVTYPGNPTAAENEAALIASVVLSLDADGDATNGISIPTTVIDLFNTYVPVGTNLSDGSSTISDAVLAVLAANPTGTMMSAPVTIAEAKSHLVEIAEAIAHGVYDQPAPIVISGPSGGTGGTGATGGVTP